MKEDNSGTDEAHLKTTEQNKQKSKVYLLLCICCVHWGHGEHVDVREELWRWCTHHNLCEFWGLNQVTSIAQQTILPIQPSHQSWALHLSWLNKEEKNFFCILEMLLINYYCQVHKDCSRSYLQLCVIIPKAWGGPPQAKYTSPVPQLLELCTKSSAGMMKGFN